MTQPKYMRCDHIKSVHWVNKVGSWRPIAPLLACSRVKAYLSTFNGLEGVLKTLKVGL